MAAKFGLDPYRLDDAALERKLRHLYATREETFFHGTRQALLNHTERMLQLEREYASRFPERTKGRRAADPQGLPDPGGAAGGPADDAIGPPPGPAPRTRVLMESQRS